MTRRIALAALLALAACGGAKPATSARSGPAAPAAGSGTAAATVTVKGVVRGTPRKFFPPQGAHTEPPRVGALIANATVSLRVWAGDEAPAGKVIASTATNDQGEYALSVPPGKYFLTVSAHVEAMIQTNGNDGKNFTDADKVADFAIIDLSALTTHDLTVRQAWPV
jgi:hypothetical protein